MWKCRYLNKLGKCRYLKCLGHKRTFAVRKRASSKSRTCRHEDGTSGPLCACTLLSVPAQAETIQMVVENIAFVTAEVNAWVNKDNFAHTATATGMSASRQSKTGKWS